MSDVQDPFAPPVTPPPDDTVVDTGRETAPTDTVKQERPVRKAEEDVKPQSYVWLANGVVRRVFDEDLPGASGSANPFGHWQESGKVYQVVGVYPVEENAGE